MAIEVLVLKHKDEIIEMALSDKVSFKTIKEMYGLDESRVKLLMKAELRPGSYRAWRKRVERFSKQRDFYKQANLRTALLDRLYGTGLNPRLHKCRLVQ